MATGVYTVRSVVGLAMVLTLLLHLVGCGQDTATPSPSHTIALTATPSPTLLRPPPLAKEELFLRIVSPISAEVVVNQSSIEIIGRTRVDALVTVGGYVIEPDIEGWFRRDLQLDQGSNIIEVIVSVASGEEKSQVLAVIYIP